MTSYQLKILPLQLKCFKYWPSEGVLLAHSLSVVLQDEQILPNYTIRTFKVSLKDQVRLHYVTVPVLAGFPNDLLEV